MCLHYKCVKEHSKNEITTAHSIVNSSTANQDFCPMAEPLIPEMKIPLYSKHFFINVSKIKGFHCKRIVFDVALFSIV